MLGRIENSALYGAHIENYAFVAGVSDGCDMLRTGVEQAKSFGTEISPEDVLKVSAQDKCFDLTLETNITGIYAAGDMVGPPYQMATAVGDGCVAGMEAATYARSLIRQLERV